MLAYGNGNAFSVSETISQGTAATSLTNLSKGIAPFKVKVKTNLSNIIQPQIYKLIGCFGKVSSSIQSMAMMISRLFCLVATAIMMTLMMMTMAMIKQAVFVQLQRSV